MNTFQALEQAAQDVAESSSLEMLKKIHMDVGQGDKIYWRIGNAGLTFQLDDTRGLFQNKKKKIWDFMTRVNVLIC